MIELQHDLICRVVERIHDYQSVRGRPLRPLFEVHGMDERTITHLAKHALEFTDEIEPSSFGYGLLLGFMVGFEVEKPELTDDDLDELRP